jgi:uncharacterized damage-inducible protein DinB
MNDILLSYATYHLWANKRIADVLVKLPETTLDQEITSSFSSLRKTVYHMWDVEYVWYQRLHLVEQTVQISAGYEGTFEQACQQWLKQSTLWAEWVKQVSPARLQHVVAYYNMRKQYGKLAVIEILMQVFNHATYHRGQLITMLRQAGITRVPGTDCSEFIQNKK